MEETIIQNNPEFIHTQLKDNAEIQECLQRQIIADSLQQNIDERMALIKQENKAEKDLIKQCRETLEREIKLPEAKVMLRTFTKEIKQFIVSARMTVLEIKHYIYTNLCSSLSNNLFRLEWATEHRTHYNTKIILEDHLTLLDLVIEEEIFADRCYGQQQAIKVQDGRFVFKLNLQKITLKELSAMLYGDLVVMDRYDQITGEFYVTQTLCGHYIGRDCAVEMIKAALSDNCSEIKCPYAKPSSQVFCEHLDFNFLKVIGIFTKEEEEQFRDKLSENFTKFKSVICPNCKISLLKDEENLNKGFCSACGFGEICYYCAKVIPENEFQCTNVECNFEDEFLQKSPLTKEFSLKFQGKNELLIAPNHRACPKCYTILEHQSGCKHMKCSGCKIEFCWICLSYPIETEEWTCKSPFQYCFEVAPVQVRNNKNYNQKIEQKQKISQKLQVNLMSEEQI